MATQTMGFKIGSESLVSFLPLSHVAAQMLDMYIPLIHAATVYFAQPDALKASPISHTRCSHLNILYFVSFTRFSHLHIAFCILYRTITSCNCILHSVYYIPYWLLTFAYCILYCILYRNFF